MYVRKGVLRSLCLGRIVEEMNKEGEGKEACPLTELDGGLLSASTESSPRMLTRRLSGVAIWAVQNLVMSPIKTVWSYAIGEDEDDYYEEEEEGEEANSGGVGTSATSGGGGKALLSLKTPRVHLGLCDAAAKMVVGYFAHRMDVERTVTLLLEGDRGGPTTAATSNTTPANTTPATGPCTFKEVCLLASSINENNSLPAAAGAATILQHLSEQDAQVLAAYMVKQGLAIREGDYFKILNTNSGGRRPSQTHTHTQTLTDADKKLLDFRLQVHKLEHVLAQREQDMLQAKQRATTLHKQGRSAQAAVELTRYKKLGVLVEKMRGAMMNLVNIHYSIEGVATDLEVFVGLQGGNAALKQANQEAKKVGMSVRSVDEAMVEAQELMAETQEVGAALAQPMGEGVGLGSGGDAEDEELLRELELLEIMETEKEKEKENVAEAAAAAAAVAKIGASLPEISHLPPPALRGSKGVGAATTEGSEKKQKKKDAVPS